jgi:Formate hydrogenlyase subunit 6/NADH:ubiquinone oxidoreductase 23 kD subunit (chain I)
MNFTTIKSLYFSATGTTQAVLRKMAMTLSMDLSLPIEEIDFTLLKQRAFPLHFDVSDMVLFGVPVYAGRVPNVLVKYLNTIQGNGSTVASVVVYGNRDFDDALLESADILEACGMKVVAGAAFVGEHSFSHVLAAGRPDSDDLLKAEDFAHRLALKIKAHDFSKPVFKGFPYPYRQHFQPRNAEQQAVDIRKVKPLTSASCVKCGLCAEICPMGSINPLDFNEVTGICIKCGACVKRCPSHAKYFDNPDYNYHKTELEKNFMRRAEPEFFV